MNDLPFSKEILRLAANAVGTGRLEAPSASATLISPVCGDRVTIDMTLEGDKITRFAHEERACVLCQASASILGDILPGRDVNDISKLINQVTAMLTEEGSTPAAPWQDYGAFAPVRGHKSRHKCVLLPLEAIEEALAEA